MEIQELKIILCRLKVGDIVDYSFKKAGEEIKCKKIVALHNNKRVLIDLLKRVF